MNLAVVIHDADVDGRRRDVTWSAGRVGSVGSVGSARGGDIDIDAAGAALVPGLHDHHIHLLALAAADASVVVGPPEVTNVDDFVAVLSRAAATAGDAGVRAVGYHESVAGDLDAPMLDAMVPSSVDVPLRIQQRGGQLWIYNSAALARGGIDRIERPGVERDRGGRPTGRLFGLDAELRGRVPAAIPDVASVGDRLAAAGITGVTDLTPTAIAGDAQLLAAHVVDPSFPVRVTITGSVDLDAGVAPDLPRGPVKFLPADHDVADIDELAAGFSRAHRGGRNVAVHCVSRIGIVVALAAWRSTGVRPGDRIEHGAVLPAELLDEIRRLGLVVVTQPNLVAERGDQYLADVDVDDLEHLWRCRSLLERGIPVAAGTDAPFGDPDPWRAIDAATTRRTVSGAVVGIGETVDPRAALDLFLGSADSPELPRRIRTGATTDLCLLDRPLIGVLAAPHDVAVRLTIGRAGVTRR